MNDWYSPLGTAKQPNFYDFWSSMYSHYIAKSVSIEFDVVNTSTSTNM